MRMTLALLFIPFVGNAAAQWSLGGSGWSSPTPGDGVRFGPAARIERRSAPRWSLWSSFGGSIPLRSKVDGVFGDPRNLATGTVEPRYLKGRYFRMERSIELGVSARMGRHRDHRKAHLYGGLSLPLIQSATWWNYNVTVIATEEQFNSRGSRSTWSCGLAPVIGFRGRERTGRFFAEARGMLRKSLTMPGAGWEPGYGATAGYLWNL